MDTSAAASSPDYALKNVGLDLNSVVASLLLLISMLLWIFHFESPSFGRACTHADATASASHQLLPTGMWDSADVPDVSTVRAAEILLGFVRPDLSQIIRGVLHRSLQGRITSQWFVDVP